MNQTESPFVEIDFFLIGAQKCATTWLYNCLNEHPEIFIGGEKREVNYLGGKKFLENGEQWFYSLFNDHQNYKITGSASVDYLNDFESIDYIKKNNENAKFIVSLRNPVHRLISAYFWLSRNDLIGDMPIEEGLKKIINAYSKNKNDSSHDNIIQRGLYFKALNKFLNDFPAENFKVVIYDDIKEAPDKVLPELYKFLEVEQGYNPLSKSRKPKGNSYNSFLVSLERKFPDNRIIKKGISLVSEILKLTNLSKQKISDDVPSDLKNELSKVYLTDLKKLKGLLEELPKTSQPVSGTRHIDNWILDFESDK